MKTLLRPLLLSLFVIGIALCPIRLPAQDAAAGGGTGARLSFLSAEDRAHYLKVRQQVLSSNPDLKSEQENLMKERQFVKNKGADAASDDRKTLRENFLAHNEKMEAAMKAADPSVGPIIDQIDAKFKERIEQRADQGGGDSGSASQ